MPFDILAAQRSLADSAYARLTTCFALFQHCPSLDQLAALRDLLDHLERAARGDLDEALYLSPIPVGTGKTTALVSFAETLMDSPEQEDVGMLITVNRIAEARDVAAKLSLHRSKLCVITSDAATNALGDHEAADKDSHAEAER